MRGEKGEVKRFTDEDEEGDGKDGAELSPPPAFCEEREVGVAEEEMAELWLVVQDSDTETSIIPPSRFSYSSKTHL